MGDFYLSWDKGMEEAQQMEDAGYVMNQYGNWVIKESDEQGKLEDSVDNG